MKKFYLIGNWKMNPATQKQANQLALSILRGVNKLRTKNVEVVICPPFSFLEEVNKKLSRNVKLGAQDIFFEDSGAYTGEISPSMLRDVGVKYVIVGHSERRRFLNETNETSVYLFSLTGVFSILEVSDALIFLPHERESISSGVRNRLSSISLISSTKYFLNISKLINLSKKWICMKLSI